MLLGKGVLPGGFKGPVPLLPFILRNHLFAPSAVACQGKGGRRIIRRKDSPCNQRINQGNKPGGVAPWHCDPFPLRNLQSVAPGQFRESVCPSFLRPVGCGGIDHSHPVIFDQPHRLSCRIIRQTQKGNIRLVDQPLSLFYILTLVRVNGKQLHILSFFKSFVDPKACGAFPPVNKNFYLHHASSSAPLFLNNHTLTYLKSQP